jgi:hypothetical protein
MRDGCKTPMSENDRRYACIYLAIELVAISIALLPR